jgi:copper chaperone CopZ
MKRVFQTLTVAAWAAGVAAATGCGGKGDVAVNEQHEAGPSAQSVARLEVSGMMCATACGGKISKELLELAGVANTEIDFVEGREVNYAEVSYDPEKIEPEALAAAVEEIAGGIYTVGEVDVTHYAEAATLP